MRTKASAFTLIELLIVIAIIAILALIALPNFLEAQTRAKVARCKADMKSIATALECYCVDCQCYPPKPAASTLRNWQASLSTPVAYIGNPMKDLFATNMDSAHTYYQYSLCPMMMSWIFVSIGPDGSDNFSETMWMCGNWATYPMPYDPTNGTVSAGDIFRVNKQGNPLPLYLRIDAN